MSREPLGRYARAIEAALSRTLGRPRVLSPREWALVSDWHAREIPLALVLDTLRESTARRRRPGAAPRTLGWIARGVEEAWSVVRSGRASASAPTQAPPLSSRETVLGAWRAARDRAPSGERIRALLEEVLDLAALGTAAASVDAALDVGLPDAAPEPLRSAAEADARTALREYRTRMSADAFASTLARSIVDGLRRELSLPRLTLSR